MPLSESETKDGYLSQVDTEDKWELSCCNKKYKRLVNSEVLKSES